MAKITFSLDEFIEILKSNELLPPQIIRVRAKGDNIHFVIRTDSFILPYIPASLRYLALDDNNAIFELTIVSDHFNKPISWLNQVLKLKIPQYLKVEYPKVFFDIDNLLKQKNIRGVRVKNILFESGEFTIVTGNI